MASVSNPASQVSDPLLPDLYDTKLITTNEHGMPFKGEERCRVMRAGLYPRMVNPDWGKLAS